MPVTVPVTLAISDYDHVRDLASGKVGVEGADLLVLTLSVEEIFHRFVTYREWDVSELSFAKYVSMRSHGDESLTAIPVFPSRVCRHSAIYITRGGKVTDPRDLGGRRVGVPEWSQTAGVYARGMLGEEYGLAINEVHWVQAGVNEPGRTEHVTAQPREGVEIERVSDRSLTEMLVAGDLDAIISARPPRAFTVGTGQITRLFEDSRTVEEDYVRRTGIFPIMHVVAITEQALKDRRWLAMNLFTAFEEARQHSLDRAMDWTAARFPLPWIPEYVVAAREAFGGADPFPYGIEANRTSIEAFLRYCYDQGVAERKLTAEELFTPEVGSSFRV
jgi:4,5-dihydroxyphthalate decarboxylase